MTPEQWRRSNDWKHGTPRRIVLSGELDPDPLTLPEVAGEVTPPSPRWPLSSPLLRDLVFLFGATLVLAALYLIADWMVQVR